MIQIVTSLKHLKKKMVKQKMREEVNYIDKEILKMAKKNARLKTITEWVVKECPDMDEIANLTGVVYTLKRNGFDVEDSKINEMFLQYYSVEYHGASKSYLKWLKLNIIPKKNSDSSPCQLEQTCEKTGVKHKRVVTTSVKKKSGLESKFGVKWKCPECKKERKYEKNLKMKICSCCMVEMEVVNG